MQKSIVSPEYRRLVALMRSERESRGLSQDQVAERLGLSGSQLSKWERYERRVDVRELDLYCRAIGVPLVDLIQKWEDSKDVGSIPETPIN